MTDQIDQINEDIARAIAAFAQIGSVAKVICDDIETSLQEFAAAALSGPQFHGVARYTEGKR